MNGLGSISQHDLEEAERHQRKKDRDWNERRERSPEPQFAPPPNPDELQPEYDNRPKKNIDMTKVI